MATFRLTLQQIKAIRLEDKKSWPVDLQVWVELSILHPFKEWNVPYYLNADQVKAFQELIREKIKEKTIRRRSSTSA